MEKKEFFEILEEVWELDPGTIKGDENIADLIGAWESIVVVEFISLIDEKAEITLDPEKIIDSETVQDLYDLLKSSLSN